MQDSKYLLKSPEITIVPSNEDDLWNSDWIISLRGGDKEQIGTASFAGEKALGTVPLRVELKEGYRNQGYGTEVFRLMVSWAFERKSVYEVTAVTVHENDKCVKALSKAGFIFRSSDGPVETYSVIKQKTSWTGLYVMIGIVIGCLLGVVSGNLWVGFGIGMLACLSIGASMDMGAARYRANVTGKRKH